MDKHNVRKGETLTFADQVNGEFVERTVYPLTLKSLRKFVKIIAEMDETRDALAMSDKDIDLMKQASSVILEKIDPQLAADEDRLEDAVDISVFNDMMRVAMGNADPEA